MNQTWAVPPFEEEAEPYEEGDYYETLVVINLTDAQMSINQLESDGFGND